MYCKPASDGVELVVESGDSKVIDVISSNRQREILIESEVPILDIVLLLGCCCGQNERIYNRG